MFSKIIKEIVRGQTFPCLFLLLYIMITWWAVLSGQPIAVKATWVMTFLLGIIIVITGVVTSIDAWQSHSWLIVRAKLAECFVTKGFDSDGTTYAPAVVYQFKVGDRHFQGSSYDFSDFSGSLTTANEKIESLRQLVDADGCINIYYKPSEPELNVIYPGVHPIHCIRLIFGFILIGLSLLTLVGIIQW